MTVDAGVGLEVAAFDEARQNVGGIGLHRDFLARPHPADVIDRLGDAKLQTPLAMDAAAHPPDREAALGRRSVLFARRPAGCRHAAVAGLFHVAVFHQIHRQRRQVG